MVRVLDLFCGAGGAAVGYHRAGFDVVGVDIAPQPHYPFTFVRADALTYLREHGKEFDVIHASPPCQVHSPMAAVTGRSYVDLVPSTVASLDALGVPYVVENVPLAPIRRDALLCGTMFGLEVIRHRAFQCSFALPALAPADHSCRNATITGRVVAFRNGGRVVAGRTRPLRTGAAEFRDAMGCTWMTAHEARQAIPPAYTEWLGSCCRASVRELVR